MQAGNIVLVSLVQSNGVEKLQPVLLLKALPRFNDFLVCGISTQLHQYLNGFDEILGEQQHYFAETGLHKTSLIRLFLSRSLSKETLPVVLAKYPWGCIKTS